MSLLTSGIIKIENKGEDLITKSISDAINICGCGAHKRRSSESRGFRVYSLLHRNFARLVDLQTQLDVGLLQEHRGRAVQLRQVVGQLHQLVTPLLERKSKFECSREINWFCRSFVHVSRAVEGSSLIRA